MTASNCATRVVEDLETMARDTGELARATSRSLAESAGEARERFSAGLEKAKSCCEDATARLRKGLREADGLVHEHPYKAIAMGFAVGVIAAFLVRRK